MKFDFMFLPSADVVFPGQDKKPSKTFPCGQKDEPFFLFFHTWCQTFSFSVNLILSRQISSNVAIIIP